ncbi:MAG TPA: hypothetical protein VJ953_09175 [Saprospiraceae bacterium]|nr:hypothetical protein [Saprospiraceae bacterium]
MNNLSSIKIVRLVFLLCLLPVFGYSQEIRENEHGEKMIVYPDGRWRYFNENQIHPPGTFPTLNDTISELDAPTNLTETVVRKLLNRKSQIAAKANSIAQERTVEAVELRQRLEKKLESLKKQDGLNSQEVKRLQLQLDAAKELEKTARREAILAQHELQDTHEMAQKGNLLEAFVQKQKDRATKIELKSTTAGSEFFTATMTTPEEFRYTDMRLEDNLMINPPSESCRFAHNAYDAKLQRYRREMPSGELFSYTDDRLRFYLKDKAYLSCNAYLSTIGGLRLLNLEFKFAYPNASEAYGFIEKGSILTLLFLNGDFINLQAGILANGQYDMETEELTYRVQYPISNAQITYLKKGDLDRVRVYWSSGYEEYEVFDVDFLGQQADCLGW